MKSIFLLVMAWAVLLVYACKDEGPDMGFEYHADIHQPSNADRMVGDTLPIEVDFESHTGMTVHHINVRIFNLSTLTEVYSQPAEAHIHETSGAYTFEDTFILSAANGISEGDWVLEAKVWGDEDGLDEISEQVQFHVNP